MLAGQDKFALKKPCGTKTLLDCGSPAAALGKPALLASLTTNPALKPNHKKPPITAIHAERPTPGSKLPSATKREQALALKKHCGTKTLLDCGSPAAALGKPALLASRTTTPACEPNHANLRLPQSTPSAPPGKQASLRRKARASSRTQEALRYQDAFGLRKPCCRFGEASSAGVAHHHPSAQAQPRKASDNPNPRRAPHPRKQASLTPPRRCPQIHVSESALPPKGLLASDLNPASRSSAAPAAQV